MLSALHRRHLAIAAFVASVGLLGCHIEPPDDDDTFGAEGGSGGGSSTADGSTSSTGAGMDPPDDDGSSSQSSGAGGSTGSGNMPECDAHLDCGTAEFCKDYTCQSAWGQFVELQVIEGSIMPTKPDSQDAWDINSGAPDPYVLIYEGEEVVGQSTTIDDTHDPTWNEGTTVRLSQSGPDIAFAMVDEDIADDDFITGAVYTQAEWIEIMREYEGGVVLTDAAGNALTLDIVPE